MSADCELGNTGDNVNALESARVARPIVTWYSADDPENPKNWPGWKKAVVYLIICFYTAISQASVSIFTPSQMLLPAIFDISITVSSLGLGLFVFGYGAGGLLLSPLSEIPVIGRNPPYVVSITCFTLFAIGAPLTNTIAGILILRWLQGVMAAAILNTGGASLADITTMYELPYGMYSWAVFAFVGPAIGPIISGFTIDAGYSWRFPLWEIVFLAAPTLILVFLLPETSAPRILYARAQRLRQLTQDPGLRSQYEVQREKEETTGKRSALNLLYSALIIPWKIHALDPSILFTTVYCCLVYCSYYLYFEVFPLVYMDQHGMSVSQMGLVYLCVPVGTFLAAIPYFAFIHWQVHAPMRRDGTVPEPEHRLVPALGASIIIPVGLFLFAWTGRSAHIHWIVPTVGAMLVAGGNAIIFQSIYVYVALAYPRYAASLFGCNGFIRATVACGAVLVAQPLYNGLGIAGGTSLVAGLCCLCTLGMFALYHFGAALRARSRFTAKS